MILQPDTQTYNSQLQSKVKTLSDILAPFSAPPLQVHESDKINFRMRSEFRIWHYGDRCQYVMFPNGSKSAPVALENYDIASTAINNIMPKLMSDINQSEILRQKLFQIDFLSSQSGELLTTLIYHKALEDEWLEAAKNLQGLGTHIIGRSRKQKICLSHDFITEHFTVDGKTYSYQQIENSFTQPNASVNQHMLNWAVKQAKAFHKKGDLLELYCGNGNFTLPLSQHFPKVLATEISKTSVNSALLNMENNAISNVELVRISSEDLASHAQGEKLRRRLRNWSNYEFSTLFVDPPRSGLDPASLTISKNFNHIIYISCNPYTLADNLTLLSQTHRITHTALFDQFPYTDHMETGIILERR